MVKFMEMHIRPHVTIELLNVDDIFCEGYAKIKLMIED